MADTPTFANPPIVELVLGAQFSPLVKLTSGHYGRFWQVLGPEWAEPTDAPPLPDRFEVFGDPLWARSRHLELLIGPPQLPARFTLKHRDAENDRLIQLQPTRFHLNWRRRRGEYPSYRRLVGEFEELFERFRQFVTDEGVGPVLVNQWELTYVDAFRKGDCWQELADWEQLLPGLFGPLRAADGLVLEHRAAEWSYEFDRPRGRLHLSARPGRAVGDDTPALLLEWTARGPVGPDGAADLRAGLDAGHRAAVDTFLRITADEVKNRWGVKP